MGESTSKLGESGDAADFAVTGLDKLSGEIGNAGTFDKPDIRDPQQLLEYKRAKIEAEHEGLRGVVAHVHSAIWGQPSYQSEMARLGDVEQYSAEDDAKSAAAVRAQQEHLRLEQFSQGLDSTLAAEGKTDVQRERESADQSLDATLQLADQIASGRTFFSQGFKNQTEANAFAAHLRQSAAAIHTAERDKIEMAREGQHASDQAQLDAVNQEARGDITGATRTLLENQLNEERMTIDPNDKDRVAMFDLIDRGKLANFDADVASKSKFDKAQIDDRIAGFQEDSREAELRAEGKGDEAQIDALKFKNRQAIKSLREQSDATADPTQRAELQKAIDAATSAGNSQLDSLRKQLQLESHAGDPSASPLHDGKDIAPAFAEAVKKLDDAATKLDEALSKAKGVQLLAD
jgi:hypothetical protein